MLKYLIIQLDDTSASFCHYPNKHQRNLISLEALNAGVLWALKENLMVQFVYPDYELPKDYLDVIDSIDHIDIAHEHIRADVSIFDGAHSLSTLKTSEFTHAILRVTKDELFNNVMDVKEALEKQTSLNIVITDIETFKDSDFESYKQFLTELSSIVEQKIVSKKRVNINILTDRLGLSSMNNCNAGVESITLAPDGNFYICPASYYCKEGCIGNPVNGLHIPNEQLYKLEYSPIFRICDAFQCKRCVWLNHKTTGEVNTPSHEQCVVAHLERNTSRALLERLIQSGKIKTDMTIPEIAYLDPFDEIKR